MGTLKTKSPKTGAISRSSAHTVLSQLRAPGAAFKGVYLELKEDKICLYQAIYRLPLPIIPEISFFQYELCKQRFVQSNK